MLKEIIEERFDDSKWMWFSRNNACEKILTPSVCKKAYILKTMSIWRLLSKVIAPIIYGKKKWTPLDWYFRYVFQRLTGQTWQLSFRLQQSGTVLFVRRYTSESSRFLPNWADYRYPRQTCRRVHLEAVFLLFFPDLG